MLKPYQKKIIDGLVRQETLLAKLYTLFAEQFPEHAQAWSELAIEEKKHASWLQQLHDAGEKGIILFDEGKIKTYTMDTFINYLEGIIAKAESGELSLANAISHTIDLERSLLEKNTFSHFDSTSEKARSVLKRLTRETENHIERIKAIKG